MARKTHRIVNVEPGSIAEELGIQPGDLLADINGREIVDVLDYIDWTSGEQLEMRIIKQNGEEWILEIEKEPEEDIGLTFEQALMDHQRNCGNQCIFCFVDQLPRQMRKSVYFKDDDWRLSFMMGNYITLTNMSNKDVERIIGKHISPLYISVHTTNPELRVRMMRNKRAGEVLDILKRFCEADIKLHCQIVLCPGWNDGDELERTLSDLWAFHRSILSVAVVPVGLTGHRTGLEPIQPYNRETAGQVLDQVEKWQERCKAEKGTNFVFAADEFYILAERSFPSYESYEDFPQIENGVGMIVKFQKEFEEALSGWEGSKGLSRELSILTGESSYRFIQGLVDRIPKGKNGKIHVYAIPNRFFGGHVTVSGLVTGQDILAGVQGKSLGQEVLIPKVMLREGDDVFLDDTRLEELESMLKVPVIPVQIDGGALLKEILK